MTPDPFDPPDDGDPPLSPCPACGDARCEDDGDGPACVNARADWRHDHEREMDDRDEAMLRAAGPRRMGT